MADLTDLTLKNL